MLLKIISNCNCKHILGRNKKEGGTFKGSRGQLVEKAVGAEIQRNYKIDHINGLHWKFVHVGRHRGMNG